MTDYELLLLLDPELTEERQAEIVARVGDLVTKGGGAVEAHHPWGRRRLAYEIARRAEGFYHLLLFSAEPETLDEISRVLKIDDAVLRFMATRRIEGSPGRPVAVGAPDSEDVEDEPDAALEEE